LADGRELFTVLHGSEMVTSLAFSPDGRYLATAGGPSVGQPLDEEQFFRATFSGNRLDSPIKVWDAKTGKLVPVLRGHIGTVSQIAFSPQDSSLLASACIEDLTVRLWDVTTGRERYVLRGHTRPVTSLAFSPDGRRLASASVKRREKPSLQG